MKKIAVYIVSCAFLIVACSDKIVSDDSWIGVEVESDALGLTEEVSQIQTTLVFGSDRIKYTIEGATRDEDDVRDILAFNLANLASVIDGEYEVNFYIDGKKIESKTGKTKYEGDLIEREEAACLYRSLVHATASNTGFVIVGENTPETMDDSDCEVEYVEGAYCEGMYWYPCAAKYECDSGASGCYEVDPALCAVQD